MRGQGLEPSAHVGERRVLGEGHTAAFRFNKARDLQPPRWFPSTPPKKIVTIFFLYKGEKLKRHMERNKRGQKEKGRDAVLTVKTHARDCPR